MVERDKSAITRDEAIDDLQDFYARHKHSSFHQDQMLAQVGDTPDEDRPPPQWLIEAEMDDDEWADMKAEQMIQERIKKEKGGMSGK